MEHTQVDLEEQGLRALAMRMGGDFHTWGLLQRALTHRSYVNEHADVIEDNERLEFLGDAVLNFLVGSWLYHHFPEMAEGQLTRMRAALVGNDALADQARQLGMDQLMRLGKGEESTGGRRRTALLGCTFEAVVGALCLDQGMPAVQSFIDPLLEQAAVRVIENQRGLDAKSQLQEWSQGKGLGAPVYRVMGTSGPEHQKVFEVQVEIGGQIYGRGQGSSKQAATKAAARDALSKLDLNN